MPDHINRRANSAAFSAYQLRLEHVEQALTAVNAQFVVYCPDIIRDGVVAEMQVFGDFSLRLTLSKQQANVLELG